MINCKKKKKKKNLIYYFAQDLKISKDGHEFNGILTTI